MPRLLLATNNRGKVGEYRTLLAGCGWEIVTPADIGLELDVDESGPDYATNARIKAEAFAEAGEEPSEALLREIREETGVEASILSAEEELGLDYPRQLPAPYTILLENSPETPPHQHIDLIYFCRLTGGPPALRRDGRFLTWVDKGQLERGEAIPLGDGGPAMPAPDDVRLLALKAIQASRDWGG